jgi:hypothetical protein
MATGAMPQHRLPAWRALAHGLLVVVGWVGFVWLWALVARRPWESAPLVWLTGGSLLAAPLLTALWVRHNRSIHRRKGERRSVANVDTGYARDWHGRPVRANWEMLARSRYVTIEVVDGHKLYRGAPDAPRVAPPGRAGTRPIRPRDWPDTVT